MNYKDFKSNKITPKPVFALFGEDRFLCHQALEALKATFAPNLPDINIETVAGENLDVGALENALKICPLGDAFRVIVLEDLKPKKNGKLDLTFIENYAKSTDFVGILVIYNPGESVAPKIDGAILVNCSRLEVVDLIPLILERAKNGGATINKAVATKLCDYCGNDLTNIYSEIDKLCAYAYGAEITADMLDELVSKTADYQIFEITSKIASGDKNGAMMVATSLIKTEKSLYSIIGMLYNTYRRALFLSINKEKTDAELAGIFGIKEYAVKKLREQTKMFGARKLKQIVDNLSRLDANIKQGKIKDEIGLEVALFEILNMI